MAAKEGRVASITIFASGSAAVKGSRLHTCGAKHRREYTARRRKLDANLLALRQRYNNNKFWAWITGSRILARSTSKRISSPGGKISGGRSCDEIRKLLFARCIFPPFLSCYKDNIVVVAPAFLSSFSFPAPRFQRPPIAFPLFSSSIRARPTRFKATRLISNEKTVYERDIGLSSLSFCFRFSRIPSRVMLEECVRKNGLRETRILTSNLKYSNLGGGKSWRD